MKLKNLSKILAFGILLNSIPINSFAGILSKDTRYETFEGDSIKIDNILEEDNVDVEIEGNTLVNLYKKNVPIGMGGVLSETGKSIYRLTKDERIDSGYLQFSIDSSLLKNDTRYTIILKNYYNTNLESKVVLYDRTEGRRISNAFKVTDFNENITLTTKSDININNNIQLLLYTGATEGDYIEVSNEILLLEGTFQQRQINYFEGIKSVGELENNTITIKSKSKDNFTNNKDGLICHLKPGVSKINNNIMEDLSGNNNNATLFNLDENSVVDNYLQFDGVNDYATIQRIVQDDFTIMIKVDVEEVNGGSNIPEGHWYNYAGIIDGEIQGVVNDFGITITREGYPSFGIGNPDKTYTYRKSCLNSIKTFVFSRNKNKGVVDIYIDGEFVGEITDANKNSLISPQQLTIAKSNSMDRFVKMKLFELKIYDKSLQEDEIYLSDKKIIQLNEPLRGLPNGVKDRIIKKNGQWYVERNIGHLILDGSMDENWYLHSDSVNKINTYCITFHDAVLTDARDAKSLLSNNFKSIDGIWQDKVEFDIEGIDLAGDNKKRDINIRILKSKISGENIVESFREYLSVKPISLIYQRVSPIYEPIDFNSLQLYLDTTHISTNSTVPANLKVTVDRVANRAKEYNELAQENPTIQNISLARMWTNKMRESILKDKFQDNIDSISEIVDLQLERKISSSNIDVYIKSENMLSMSLDTNSIMFDDFSGVEDIEKANAVNITINSSLPYQLNAYLPTEIQNSDKTKTMNKEILQLKESSESAYQAFSNTTDKVVLKDNCNSGNQLVHGIDIMLKGGIAHEKDVYKAVIKLEAEQK